MYWEWAARADLAFCCRTRCNFFLWIHNLSEHITPSYEPVFCALSSGGGPIPARARPHKHLVQFTRISWKNCLKCWRKCKISQSYAPYISHLTPNSNFSGNFATGTGSWPNFVLQIASQGYNIKRNIFARKMAIFSCTSTRSLGY